MKKYISIAIGFIVLGIASYVIFQKPEVDNTQEQVVFEKTYTISKEYVALRYRTDEVLQQASKYPDYTSWNTVMASTIRDWEKLEQDALALEKLAQEMSEEKVSFYMVKEAVAYDKQEISDIFDKAPAGKKIATLAKHLGVDAQRAFKILQQDQNQVTADAWTDAGDTFKKLEVSAVVIKDTCKIAGFVGGAIITGGASTAVVGSTLANTTAVITGADLVLEVTEDAATIALGDGNRIATIANTARKITEPISTLIAINDIPKNLQTGYQKFTSVMVGVDQFRGAAQDGKIIGIELPTASDEKVGFENIRKHKAPVYVTTGTSEEIDKWLEEQGVTANDVKQVDVKKILGVTEIVSGEVGNESTVEDATTSSSTDGAVNNNTSNITIVSPEGKSFVPQSGLSFAVAMRSPEAVMTDGRNVQVWCRWTFYLDDVLYVEKVNPSTIHPATKNVCEYSTLLIEQKGKLRVEFNLERGTKSKYSEESSIQTIDKTHREYTVQ